jgi:aminoglycoside 3-N-acetyltransferase
MHSTELEQRMWNEERLVEDLWELGLPEGAHVLGHVSLRAIGPIEGGAETLLRAFRRVLGPTGTLLVPTFTPQFTDPAESEGAPDSAEEVEKLRAAIPVFDAETTPAARLAVGVFPEIARQQPDAHRSSHPVASFTAIGERADFLTADAPFHYPLGTDSPLARLHQVNGWVLLIGVGQEVNSSLHLAEVWANVAYVHRSARVKTGADRWTTMQGSPECSEGFPKIEPLLRQARILRRGYVGNAPAQLMRQRELVSMAVAMLQGSGEALLCDDPLCPWCSAARKFTAESTHLEGHSL